MRIRIQKPVRATMDVIPMLKFWSDLNDVEYFAIILGLSECAQSAFVP